MRKILISEKVSSRLVTISYVEIKFNIMNEIENPSKSYLEYPGPILLLAGPGTGKTYQLAQRVKFLINAMNISPKEIAVITFTTEAARNMRDSLLKDDIAIPKENHPEIITTMHSLANMIIGANTSYFGISNNYGVLTEKYSQKIIFEDASYLCGYSRDEFVTAIECRRKGECYEDMNEINCKICKKYEEILRKCSLIDYDDQILLANKILREDEQVRMEWNNKTKFLLVDEYQDINSAQFEFISLLSSLNREGLFVVGDDDQSIYSFRGGSPHFIQNFGDHFNNSKIGRLAKSWRCPEFILRSAKEVIQKYYPQSVSKPEPEFSNNVKNENEKIFILDVPSSKKESELIAKICAKKYKDKKVCIIIPNGMYFSDIKEALRNYKLPYKYKTKLDEDGICRFLLLDDWKDDQNNSVLLRTIIELIINNYKDFTKDFPIDSKKITEKRESFSNLIATLWNNVNSDNSFYSVLQNYLFTSEHKDITDRLKGFLTETVDLLNDGGKKQNLPIFLEKVGLYLSPGNNISNLLSEVREWKSEIIGNGIDNSYPPIEIYNMPSSKGLEGDLIIVVGLSQELFPNPDRDIDEQSRLLYVAMTRAKEELFLCSARTRSSSITFKDASFQLKKSEFINCLPKKYVKEFYLKK